MTELSASNIAVTKGKKLILSIGSLCVPAAELSMVLGANGAGKTTLLRALMGLEAGHIAVHCGDKRLDRMAPRQKAALIQWVPARHHIPFAFSVQDILRIGRFPIHQGFPSAVDEQVIGMVAEQCGVSAWLSRQYHSLSNGEQAKVHIARALVMNPRILILDEPCASLDVSSTHQILTHLSLLKEQGVSILMTHHDLYTVRPYCDHVVWLKAGLLVGSGPVAEAFTQSAVKAVFDFELPRPMSPYT